MLALMSSCVSYSVPTVAHLFQIEIFQEGRSEVADEILSKDFVWHNPGFPPEMKPLLGSEGVKQMANALTSAFPTGRLLPITKRL